VGDVSEGDGGDGECRDDEAEIDDDRGAAYCSCSVGEDDETSASVEVDAACIGAVLHAE
jgi:hypothetical protein